MESAANLDSEPKPIVVTIGDLRNYYVQRIGELVQECTEVKDGRFVIDEQKWEQELMPFAGPIIDYVKRATGLSSLPEPVLRTVGLNGYPWELK